MQDEWVAEAAADFQRRFDREADSYALAPGRVNLIGEHTDYNEGLALPCAIDRHALALISLRDDGRCRVHACDLDERAEFDVSSPTRQGGFVDYVQGVVAALTGAGLRVSGFDLSIRSRVPLGAGLSSSAALGVSVMRAIDNAAGFGLEVARLAGLAHHGECDFVGVQCGILDQFASALGKRGHAIRIDCRTRACEAVPLRGGELGLLLAHSGVSRELADGSYNVRVAECRAALAAAREAGLAPEGASSLRDLEGVQLRELARVLDPLLFRRVRHVLSENERVDAFVAAMRSGDHAALGSLLAAGQRSLRDDYAVSTPELDVLCELGADCQGVVGSRMTGAGFGGCTLHLVLPARLDDVRQQLSTGFERRFGRALRTISVETSDGARAGRIADV